MSPTTYISVLTQSVKENNVYTSTTSNKVGKEPLLAHRQYPSGSSNCVAAVTASRRGLKQLHLEVEARAGVIILVFRQFVP